MASLRRRTYPFPPQCLVARLGLNVIEGKAVQKQWVWELMRHIRQDLLLVSGVISPLISLESNPVELWLGHKTLQFMNYASLNTLSTELCLMDKPAPWALDTDISPRNANRLAAVYTCAACQQLCSRPLITGICFSLNPWAFSMTLWTRQCGIYTFNTAFLIHTLSSPFMCESVYFPLNLGRWGQDKSIWTADAWSWVKRLSFNS